MGVMFKLDRSKLTHNTDTRIVYTPIVYLLARNRWWGAYDKSPSAADAGQGAKTEGRPTVVAK